MAGAHMPFTTIDTSALPDGLNRQAMLVKVLLIVFVHSRESATAIPVKVDV